MELQRLVDNLSAIKMKGDCSDNWVRENLNTLWGIFIYHNFSHFTDQTSNGVIR